MQGVDRAQSNSPADHSTELGKDRKRDVAAGARWLAQFDCQDQSDSTASSDSATPMRIFFGVDMGLLQRSRPAVRSNRRGVGQPVGRGTDG